MGILSFLSPISNLFKSNNKNKTPKIGSTEWLWGQLQPYLNQQKDVSDTALSGGKSDLGSAREGYNTSLDYWINKLGMTREDALKEIDDNAISKEYDVQEQVLRDYAPRGGQRASRIGNLQFSRAAEINRLVNQILTGGKDMAASAIAQLSQGMGNLGLGELSAASGAGAQASNILFGVNTAKINQDQVDAQKLASIFGAIGSAAGAAAAFCITPDSLVLTPSGYKPANELRKGEEIITFDTDDSKGIHKIIRLTTAPNQRIYKVTTESGKILKATGAHALRPKIGDEISIDALSVDSRIRTISKNIVRDERITEIKPLLQKSSVVVIKIDSEDKNYGFATNGLISIDDYRLR